MLKNFINTFNKLPQSNKSMVYLMWIYSVWTIISGIFINIFIYKLQNNFSYNIYYNLVFFTFTFIGFSGTWWIISLFKKDIKNMYYLSYIWFILSFIFLFILKTNLIWIFLFTIIYWLSFWMFWLAVHTQELKNIQDKNRDFYSSSISAWKNLIEIIVPFLVAFIFFISVFVNIDWYFVLFFILPFIYSISFLFIKNIKSYIPKKIKKDDIKNFFNFKKYKWGHLYFLIWWFANWIDSAILWVISIILLKNEVNIWLFQWILAIVSTFLIFHLSVKRNPKNRLKYFFIFSLLLFINYTIFGVSFSLIAFIIFSLVWLFLNPLYRVSQHTYDLALMDNIKTKTSDFYPAMLFREIVLWIWRILGLIFILLLFYSTNFSLEKVLKISLILIWISFIFSFIFIYFWDKNEK